MTVIRGRQLTRFDVAPDGESVSIQVMDEEGRPAALVLPSECLNGLLMTLPEMVRQTLSIRFQNQTMRLVYPVGSWEVESSAVPGSAVVTLRTPDGFAVSFGLSALELLRMSARGASLSHEATGIIGN